MNHNTYRGLLIAALCANIVMLVVALLDHSRWNEDNMWTIFIGWAVLILIMVILAVLAGGIRMQLVQRVSVAPPERSEPVVAKAYKVAVPRASPLMDDTPGPVKVEASSGIPFTYNAYTLYGRDVELKNGGTRPIYFFAKSKPVSGQMVAKPANMHVGVNERTGLPFLKKGTGKDGEDLTPTIEAGYRPQCSALTADGGQCRNSAREHSKYCISHFGYQPTVIPKAEAKREDTKPRVRDAPDTLPSVRRKSTA
jgi:hypothetical protein